MKSWKIFSTNNKAFTLAEVLITLGIIGIVAAMTVPVLMNYFHEKALLTQFNKAYSAISQAYVSAAQDNLTADHWATQQDIYNNLKPYFKIVEDCGNGVGCFPNTNYRGLKGADLGFSLFGTNGSSWYKLRLADGSSIGTSTTLRMLFLDINGDKGPNKYGYDMFFLTLSSKNGTPYIYWGNDTSLNDCSKSLAATSSDYDGRSCSYWVLRHGNMDYLHRDLTSTEWNN